jgi:hypothetical protein
METRLYPSREEILRQHRRKKAVYSLCVVGIVAVCIGIISGIGKGPAVNPKPVTPQESINNQFNPWDGSHIALEKYIKDHMNDPDSYQHVETKYWKVSNDVILVMTEFRGKNSFGGVVKSNVKAEVDMQGNILKVYPK